MLIQWIPLFPFFGFIINSLLAIYEMRLDKSKQPDPEKKHPFLLVSGILATATLFASFVISVMTFVHLMKQAPESRLLKEIWFTWFQIGSFKVDWSLQMDVLSCLFVLVITGVGTLIHLYSIGYMQHDKTPARFFCYLNLFCFSMLILVLGASLPLTFLGWEGVGLCSYLLIGYWYEDEEKAYAGKKAFITNRIGDFGFLLGIFSLYALFGTLEWTSLREAVQNSATSLPSEWITGICLLLFLGCTGKSAQIPLYIWLPDAMAGPTPVSALIHAATMVTSGVYLLARLNFLFSLSPTAMHFIATIGAITAFLAASIAFTQKDIKKVLAYSTVSQLGYLFLACGVGAYTAAIFHVITHAFFKALLFLGAGSVIHGLHEEQNLFKMGGLKNKMPITYGCFALGWLTICGLPPFSGFFSKDEILWKTFQSANSFPLLWLLAILTAGMTAFYMTRLFFLTFLGNTRYSNPEKIHETSRFMTLPLQVLALLSVTGGLIGLPHWSWLESWLAPWIPLTSEHSESLLLEILHMGFSVVIAGFGLLLAFWLYRYPKTQENFVKPLAPLLSFLEHKAYIDELYHFVLVKPLYNLSSFFWKKVDQQWIDHWVVSVGSSAKQCGKFFRMFQTGSLPQSLLWFSLGMLFFLGYLSYA